MDTVGQKIHKLRREHHLSQEELGFELGVSRQAVIKWEKDEVLPNTESVRLLCDYFKVNYNYLLNDEFHNSSEIATAKIDVTEAAEVLNTRENKKKKRLRITCIVSACIFFLLFAITIFFTVWIGITLNTPNNGYVIVSTTEIEYYTFVWIIVCDVVLLILGTIMAVLARKFKM